MNKNIYRIIFNKKRGMMMAVAETANSRGKDCGGGGSTVLSIWALMRLNRLAISIAALFGSVAIVHAQIVADPNATGNKRPFVDVSANGRPLVQITTPNAAGVSHNLYNQFNVDSGGTILNNAKSVVSTQLGGYVGANPNLANGSARIILNEVTGPSVSQLRGYTEVAGQRAEVVIANPNGISCDGCGFINTSRGLLTTGTPVFGGDGSLDAFRVTKGQIQIGPNGLNSSNVDQLDLIARSVAVNGELWANRLNVIAGPNLVSYADLGVQVIQGEGNTPTVGIDVAQLGGMYANKIRLIGTEAGVGVNSLGNIAAQAGDLMIDSQGRISLSGKTTASNGLVVTGNGGLSNSGTLYGQQDVSISTQGAISNSGTVAAQGDLSVSGTTIKSTGILGAGIDANGGASYARNLQVSASGSVTASGQNAAGGDITLTGTSVDMAGAQTRAGGNATLNATAGDIDHVAGNLQAGGEVHLQAAGAINNDGGTLGATQINSSSASLSNKAGSLIQAGNGDTTIVTTGAIDNSGGTISTNGSRLNIQSTELSNIHGQINHAGTGVLSVHTGSVNNTDGSIGTNGALEVTASGLNNLCGGLYAAGRAIITATSDLTNTQGSIQAGAALAVTAANVDNSAGRMVSINVDGLTLSSSGQLTNALGTTAAGSEGGVIGSNGDVTVSAAGLSNSGSITAAGSLNATVGGALSNDNGKLVAGNDLRVAATGLSNTSGVVDAAKVNLIIPQLDNSGGKISADQLTMTATNLTNQSGLIAQYGTQATTLAVSDTLDNSNGGLIQTNSTDLSLTPQFLNNDGGTIAHAGAGRLTINAGSGTGSVSNRSGSISSNGQVDVAGASVNNQAGAVYGQNEVGITATQGDVTNRGGGYLGGNILTITANSGQVDNTDGLIEAANGVIIQTRSLSNAGGKVQNTGAAALIVSASQDITNTVAGGSGGFIGGAGTVHVAAATVNNAGGTIYGADNLTLFSNGLLTNTGGAIQGEADLSVAAGGPLRNDSGRIDASGVSSILTVSGSSIDNTAGRIVNSGSGQTQVNGGSQISNSNATGTAGMGIIGGNGNVSITTATLRNNQNGQVIAAGDLVLNVGDAVNNNSGSSLKASGNLALTASNLDNTNGQIGTLAHSGSNVVIAASNSVANAGGTIGADHDLRLSTNTLGAAGQISAGHDATFNLGSGYTVAAGVTLQANNDLTFNAAGNLSNAGTIQAVNKLTINAAGITNQSGGMLNSGDTNLVASNGYGDISNAGNISGDIVTTSSNRFDNTAAVIGENITLNANAITNQGLAAVIAASNKINLFARNSLLNADGATIYSLGGLNIAADNAQDAFGNYLHRSQQVTNSSATIETDGDLTVSADNIINKRTTLQIQRDIYDGAVSWSKYNYYWRSWGPGMTGPDTAGLMAPVTKTLPFNDSTAFGSQYGSILQVDSANNRALIQFQGNNQLWVYYKSIKKNAGNSYDMTFYEGKFCPGYGELCPYQQMVWREYSGSLVLDQFDPSRYTSPAELDRIGINGESAYDFRERSFNGSTYHDELIAASAASKMSASGKITISTGALLNDASNITAGGTIAINGTTDGSSGVVTNRGYSINKTEIGVTVDHYDRHVGNHSYATFNDTIVSALSTIDANIQSNQGVVINAPTINNTTVNAAQPAVSGSSLGTSQNNGVSASGKPRSTAAASGSAGDGASFQGNVQTVGSANVPLPDLTLPQNGLFSIHHGPEQHYLVETDPRFTNYRNFLGSDYMLSRLVMDPTAIQKRLGDGFYEQKLINDQVAGLTGKRFLDGYASAEDEFRSLMNNGVAAASQFKLTPGIALSKEQMAALTSDIVWMVEQEVSVPGGGRERVLVPVVYLTQAHQAELKPSGALIGGQNVALSGDTVTNSGIIRAQESVVARANVLDNIGGEIRGDSVDLVGRQHLMVGTDFQAAGRQGSVKGREVSLQGGDITIAGAKVAAAEALTMMADNNLTIGSATAQRSASFAWGKTGNLAENHGIMRDGGVAANWTQVQGSSVESGGSLVAAAGRDIRIKGSKVAAEGQATLVASGQVDIGADKNITASHVTGRSDSYYLDAKGYNETVVGSSVEGAQGLTVVAQGKNGSSGDVNISASTLSSREGSTIVAAAGSLTIGSDTRRRSNDLYEAGGDARIKTDEKSVEGIGSAIGGEKGVTLVAQGTSNAGRLDIIGSNVSSNGRIDVIAKDNVTIAESRTSTDYERTAHDESSGFLSHSSSDSHDRVVQNIANGSTISGDQVNILSGKSITVQGSNVVG
ncbi:MAG TPA: filamentous hemagglutinin N-terminal domain-containing protein, partial [Noviherbaspirillum sp.]|nr:filamentous hemagglutinin N-terminal domain-containing protein [Noviherbaspirillum sp.]